ncbi:MAG TPA: hypothetical protein VH143_15940 [Kofleriaceae bacterium]|jgi:hypothetical protein|nr:hypothetical protein [Kofleriaceae bacterium]
MKWVIGMLMVSACHRATPASPTRCDDPCLVLTDTAIDQAGSAYQAACSAKPVPDYSACSTASYNRACIAAAHGSISKKDSQLEPVFAAKPWFKPDPAFKLDALSQVEKDNRAALLHSTAKCKSPSVADIELEGGWIHKLPTLAVAPAETYVHDDPSGDHKVTAAQLVAYLSAISANGKQVALDAVLTDGVPTVSNHYYVAGQSDPVPSFARFVEAHSELRVLELEIYSPVDRDNKLVVWHPDGDESGGTGSAMALDEAKMGERTEGQYKMQRQSDPPPPDDGSAAKPYTPPAYHVDTKIWLALDATNAVVAIGAMHAIVTESTDTGR